MGKPKPLVGTPRELRRRWRRNLDRIYRETKYVFMNRAVFREVLTMFQENPVLNKSGSFVYEWLRGMYWRDAIMAVRRELDEQSNVINLVWLLHEIEKRPEVLTRRGYVHYFRNSIFTKEHAEEEFTNLWGTGDHVDPAIVNSHRQELQKACKRSFEVAQRIVAHRARATDTGGLTLKDIHDALDAIETCLKRYYTLLTGNGLVGAEPSIIGDWMEPFTVPWLVKSNE